MIEKSRHFEALHKEKITGGDIGLQIAYLDFLKEILVDLKKHSKGLEDKEITSLIEEGGKEVDKLEMLRHENSEIYKAVVPQRKDLPEIPESEHKITPLDQPHVKTFLEDMFNVFAGRKSSYHRQLENDFELVASQNKQNLRALVEDIEKKRIGVYSKYKIDVMINAAQGENPEL